MRMMIVNNNGAKAPKGIKMNNKEKHKLLWEAIASRVNELDEIRFANLKEKIVEELFGKQEDLDNYFYCYACKEADNICTNCPIDWGNVSGHKAPCEREGTRYTKVRFEKNQRKENALWIANAWRDDV